MLVMGASGPAHSDFAVPAFWSFMSGGGPKLQVMSRNFNWDMQRSDIHLAAMHLLPAPAFQCSTFTAIGWSSDQVKKLGQSLQGG
jgi:hypothetical protein